ncbi:hypothetical protein FGO68_gene94 [Halteria grandinella]|uniref:Transmembrane protein n=1 Tax=Halteria grandinella TaxID=5974 RepID=A0A8J8SY04_HALGN|nr:hypothetical protein FGO68_gene94 [Halteria grandinella]
MTQGQPLRKFFLCSLSSIQFFVRCNHLDIFRCQQNKNLYIWIILFIFIFLTPLLVLIDYHLNLLNTYQQQSEDYVGIAFCILTILIFLHSLINSFILTYVAKTTTKLIASLSSCSFCLLIPYGIIFQIICFILLIDSPEEYEIINSIKDIIAAPVFFTLFLVSIFVLKNIFKAQRFNYNYIQQQPPQEIYQQYQNYRWSLNIQSIFSRLKIRYISLILIIIAYIILELYCYGGLIHEMSQTNVDYQMIITFSFLIIAIPIYLILVEQIGFKDYETSSLNFWVPILLGGLSTFITVKIWEITETNSYISSISRLIGICPLLISLIQLTVGFLKSNRQNQKMFIMAISCYFFAFPLGLLLTLSDAFNDYSIAISAYTLMGIGLIPFVLVVLYYLFVIGIYLFKLPSQAVNLNFAPYKYLDLTNYAFWLNSIGYIISFHFTCFYVWNEPESATGTKKGTVIILQYFSYKDQWFYTPFYLLQLIMLQKHLAITQNKINRSQHQTRIVKRQPPVQCSRSLFYFQFHQALKMKQQKLLYQLVQLEFHQYFYTQDFSFLSKKRLLIIEGSSCH